jgi:hypothetical protein
LVQNLQKMLHHKYRTKWEIQESLPQAM